MHRIVNDEALDRLFRAARSHPAWLARPVGDTLLRAILGTAIIGHALDPDQCQHRRAAALREGTLQAASLILAARALGLDCGPIWDFDAGAAGAAFFPEGTIAANFLCALGYGDDTQLSPSEARPVFDEACQIL